MPGVRFILLALALRLISPADSLPTAETIMARVATPNKTGRKASATATSTCNTLVSSHAKATVMCEEVTDFRVTPTGAGTQQELLNLDGRLLRKHKYITYMALPPVRSRSASSPPISTETES